MRRSSLLAAVASAAILLAPAIPAQGSLVSETGTTIVTPDAQPANLTTPGVNAFGVNHDGVGDFIINGTARCTASLLQTDVGNFAITAAHCITDGSGTNTFSSGTLTFETTGGNEVINVTNAVAHPSYNGVTSDGYDVAILTLGSAPSGLVPRYNLVSSESDLLNASSATLIGYGRSGEGATGDLLNSGTKRAGVNIFETDGFEAIGDTNTDTIALGDFDNGTAANDAFGFFGAALGEGSADLGLGADEVGTASGDSGGPAFIDNGSEWVIGGVASFGRRLEFGDSSSSDVDGTLNSTFGEFVGHANVGQAEMLTFIQNQTSVIPVPAALPAGLALLVGLGLRRRRNV